MQWALKGSGAALIINQIEDANEYISILFILHIKYAYIRPNLPPVEFMFDNSCDVSTWDYLKDKLNQLFQDHHQYYTKQ